MRVETLGLCPVAPAQDHGGVAARPRLVARTVPTATSASIAMSSAAAREPCQVFKPRGRASSDAPATATRPPASNPECAPPGPRFADARRIAAGALRSTVRRRAAVIEVRRQPQIFMALLPLDFFVLTLQVTRVLGLHVDLQLHLLAKRSSPCQVPRSDGPGAPPKAQRDPNRRRSSPDGAANPGHALRACSGAPSFASNAAVHVGRMHHGRGQPRHFLRDRGALALKEIPARIVDQSEPRPCAVRRKSALSSRSDKRYSARLVNIR